MPSRHSDFVKPHPTEVLVTGFAGDPLEDKMEPSDRDYPHAELAAAMRRTTAATRQQLLTTMSALLVGVRRVAILDFPLHTNSGDLLIYLGELAIFKALGIRVIAVSEAGAYDTALYQSLPLDTLMVFHGGGDFGDLWPWEHDMRLKEARDLRQYRGLFMPQTLWFRDQQNISITQGALQELPNIQLTWRDRLSYESARELFPRTRSVLVPDSAFALDPWRRPRSTRFVRQHTFLALARTDQESSGLAAVPIPGVVRADWRRALVLEYPDRIVRQIARWERRRPGIYGMRLRKRIFHLYALIHKQSVALQMSRHRVVILDRLHAWISCMMLGVPHVVVDTKYGKISNLIDTWAPDESRFVVRSAEDAEQLARSLDLGSKSVT